MAQTSAPAPAPRQRSTRQRRALLAELAASEGFRSAQDLYGALRSGDEKVGLATVYRALQSMVEHGEVDLVQTDGGEAVYRLCSRTHHHHLVCRQCGWTIETEDRSIEKWAARVAEENGFQEVSHSVELFGICPRCQRPT
jgi:Fur family ferric uptake transcriptional regulator